MIMKMAAYQMSAAGDSDQRLTRIKAALAQAASNDADMLVGPELAVTGYGRGEVLQTLAQRADGPWVSDLQETVAQTGVSLVVGFPERDDAGCYISAVVIDRDNPATPVFYRKGQLYGTYEKSIFQSPGPATVVTDIGGLKMGFLICYDIEFPEHVRRLAQAGAEVIVVPTALPKSASAAFIARHMIRVRAFENQVFVVYADNADADARFEYQGLSSIVAPDGSVLASAPEYGDALIYAEIDRDAFAQIKEENPYLTDLQL